MTSTAAGSSVVSNVSDLASAAARTASTAVSTAGASRVGVSSTRSLPATMREMSSRSSMSCDCARVLRSMVSSARAVVAALSCP